MAELRTTLAILLLNLKLLILQLQRIGRGSSVTLTIILRLGPTLQKTLTYLLLCPQKQQAYSLIRPQSCPQPRRELQIDLQ